MEAAECDASGQARLSDGRASHLRQVLRVVPGQQVRVGLVDGPSGHAVVIESDEHGVTLACTFDPDIASRPGVDLLLALPRPKVMRRLWAQVAALGVGRVLLTNAERVERHYFDTHMLAPEHYRPLLLEGLQQARDTRVPVVSLHKQLKILVEDDLDRLCPDTTRVMADPGAGSTLEATLAAADRRRRTLLAVGPEGGWNDFERRLFARHGFQAVSMGPRTLRTDTACVALLARVHALHVRAGSTVPFSQAKQRLEWNPRHRCAPWCWFPGAATPASPRTRRFASNAR